jgi:uncharacterized protein YndB with AHSA1/START domain
MAEYHFLTIWRIEAPLEKVYAAIENSLRWPQWWPSVREVEQKANGAADGVGNVRRYAWQGKLPYRVVFDVRATRIENLVAIEGTAEGDLAGVGRWKFSRQGAVSVVHYEWHVRSQRWWMNVVAPVARSIFTRNHAQIMEQGGKALARMLKAPLRGQQHIDLMAVAVPPGVARGRLRQRGRIELALAMIVGLGAGTIATAAQLVLWWLAAMPVLETLFRDARLTAAMVLGSGVLPPSSTAQWNVLLVATLIHFALSFAYALIPTHLAGQLRTGSALWIGALYGLILYVVNMYGFTLLFPWFAVVRDWMTVAAHIVFGVVLVAGCRLFSAGSTTSGTNAS